MLNSPCRVLAAFAGRAPSAHTTRWRSGLDWIEQGLTSHSTHFRWFRRRWGECGRVSLMEHAFTCASTTNHAERRPNATHLLARLEHERTTAWWSRAQGGGPSVILTNSRHPLQAPLNLSVMICHRSERTQADPPCLSENLIS